MPSKWKESRLNAAQKRALVWGLAAFILCLVMNAYHYSLQGAKGLYIWNRTGMFRAFILMGFVPIGIALLSFPLDKLKSKTPAKIFRGSAIVLSILVGAASLGILGFLFLGPRSGSLEQTRIVLVNPSKGISRVNLGEAAFSAGGKVASGSKAETVQAGAPKPSLRISISSDPHWGVESSDASARSEILASISEHKPDVFFMLGDTVETGSQVGEWNSALTDLEALLPKTPLRPLLGNHDALFGGQYLFKKAFFPKGLSSDSGSPYYYSIVDPAATFIVLDLPWGTEEFKGAQKSWLMAALKKANRAKPIVVLSHSYFYASGYDDPGLDKPWYDHYQDIPAIVPILREYGVSLVVSGHNHYQEFLQKDGVSYAVIGAMGGIPDPAPAHLSLASKWLAVSTFGRLDVDFYEGRMVLSFRDAAGTLLHEETIAQQR
ncbi:MAG: metallophosphoesterase [Spirochaetes bacterium]|nr:metallophosphoesterase [Spirochaetota bacterium]